MLVAGILLIPFHDKSHEMSDIDTLTCHEKKDLVSLNLTIHI